MAGVLNLWFSIFKDFAVSALFQRAAAAGFRKIEEKSFTKLWALDCWFSRTKSSAFFGRSKRARRLEVLYMGEELTPQKEKFLQEVEQKLLRRDLDARLLENGLIHVRWNEKLLCSVDRDGIVRFRPAGYYGTGSR